MRPEREARAQCAHCGLPLATSAPLGGEAYCCSGCFLAHRLSHRGLEARADRLLSRVVLSALLAMGVMVFSLSLYGGMLHDQGEGETARALTGLFRLGALAFSTPVMVLLGLPLFDAVVALRRWLSSEALILAGTLAAWSLSLWNTFRGGGEVYFDTATMVLVLYNVGRWLDVRARERATEELRRILPESEAPVARVEGAAESPVRAADVLVGDLVRVRPGEVVPVDGRIEAGRSFADASALTGEAQPRTYATGDFVHAGVVLVDGTLEVRAHATAGHRLRDDVERLFQEALARRSRWVRIADRLAASLMPVVTLLALATVALRWKLVGPERACLDALSVVLISCPCALGLATPLAFWTAMGSAWKRGVLVRGGEALESLARVRTMLFDKTGTLTSGELELERVEVLDGASEDSALQCAAALELGSEHPIARSLVRAWRARTQEALPRVHDFRALPGLGVEGLVDGRSCSLTSAREAGASEGATTVALACEGELVARISLRSKARPEAAGVLRALEQLGLDLAVLTGDSRSAGAALARELGVRVETELSPADKVTRIQSLGRGVAFVGDGLNDAAALAAAQTGIAVAGGSALSLSAAQIALLRPGLQELPELVALARSAVATAKLNLAWAFLYNSAGLYLAITGHLTPIFAASAMVASSLVSVLNSGRLRAGAAPSKTRADGLVPLDGALAHGAQAAT